MFFFIFYFFFCIGPVVSSSVERFSVSRMRDFLGNMLTINIPFNVLAEACNMSPFLPLQRKVDMVHRERGGPWQEMGDIHYFMSSIRG